MANLIKNALTVLNGIFSPRTQAWEQHSGHSKNESFIVIRIGRIKKGELRRLHSLIEDIMIYEHGEGDRE